MLEKYISKDIVKASESDTLFSISVMMREFDVGFIPIVKDEEIIGVITDRDIIVNCISKRIRLNNKASKYMTKNVVTIDINSSTEDALLKMATNKITRLIVTENNITKGIISLSDIASKCDESLVTNTYKNIKSFNSDNKQNTKVGYFKL